MRKLIVANWKENPRNEAAAIKLFKDIARIPGGRGGNADIVVCPPFIYLEKIATIAKKTKITLGAQDVFSQEKGAFTSEVGPKMIKGLGVRYVIIGHSERRKYEKETDAMINKKIIAAVKDRLHVILCVGESIEIRKKGITSARTFIKNQLKKDLKNIKGNLTIAYEPIWAIGTGRSDKPEDAVEMARFIKNELKNVKFLYGGSVNGKNARDYVQWKEINGALVGGASLKAGEFEKIIAAAGVAAVVERTAAKK